MQVSRCAMLLLLSLVGCSARSALKPSEVLDERTGMTVEGLRRPIELAQSTANLPTRGAHISFAYLGPVEWDRSGNPTYGLWVHLAPGNDWQFAAIRAPGSVVLALDIGSTTLRTIEPPALAHAPYQPVAPWGQSAYFGADAALLKKMAHSASIELDVQTSSGTPVRFIAPPAAHAALIRYVDQQGF